MPIDENDVLYTEDAKQWVSIIESTHPSLYAGEKFCNSFGRNYLILEDSPNTNYYVRVKSDYPINSIRTIAKALLFA